MMNSGRTYAVRRAEACKKVILNGIDFAWGVLKKGGVFVNYFCTSRRGGTA